MAYGVGVLDITLLSSGTSTSDQYKGVVATSSYKSGYFAIVAARGGKGTGVLQEASTEADVGLRVRVAGITKVAAGDSSSMDVAITEGLHLVWSSKGQAVPTSSGGLFVAGQAFESLSTGSTGVITMLLAGVATLATAT